MVVRILILVSFLALIAACTEDGGRAPSSSTTAPAPSTTEVERRQYSYGFRAGQELVYRLDLERRVVIDSEGDGREEVVGDLPAQADLMVTASGLFTYSIGQGPDEGTYLITIEGDYHELQVTGTLDGETLEEPGQAGQLVALGAESTTLVVDSAGHVVESVFADGPEAGLPGTSGGAAGFMGPVLPPDPVGVGETWGETFTEMAMGAAAVEGVLEGRLAGSDGGAVVFENVKSTASGQIDMAPFYREFLMATAEEGEDVQGLDELVFRIAIDPSETRITGRIDPARGLPLQTTVESSTRTGTESALPDPDTGELGSYAMSIGIDQTLAYELVEGDSE